MFSASVQALRRLPLCVGLSTARSGSRGPGTLLETHPGAAIQPGCQAALASPDRPAGSFEDRATTQETLASRPMIVMPGLLRDGAAPQSSTARLPATGQNQPYPHTASRPASRSCSTAARPPAEFVLTWN